MSWDDRVLSLVRLVCRESRGVKKETVTFPHLDFCLEIGQFLKASFALLLLAKMEEQELDLPSYLKETKNIRSMWKFFSRHWHQAMKKSDPWETGWALLLPLSSCLERVFLLCGRGSENPGGVQWTPWVRKQCKESGKAEVAAVHRMKDQRGQSGLENSGYPRGLSLKYSAKHWAVHTREEVTWGLGENHQEGVEVSAQCWHRMPAPIRLQKLMLSRALDGGYKRLVPQEWIISLTTVMVLLHKPWAWDPKRIKLFPSNCILKQNSRIYLRIQKYPAPTK